MAHIDEISAAILVVGGMIVIAIGAVASALREIAEQQERANEIAEERLILEQRE